MPATGCGDCRTTFLPPNPWHRQNPDLNRKRGRLASCPDGSLVAGRGSPARARVERDKKLVSRPEGSLVAGRGSPARARVERDKKILYKGEDCAILFPGGAVF